MSKIESTALSTLSRAARGREPSTSRSLIVILGSMLLAAAGCGDPGEDHGLVDAGVPDAALPDAALPDAALPDALLADASPAPRPVYFLVAELPGEEDHNDSYVLPLTRADHIAYARDLIEYGPKTMGRHIVVATMRAGANGINRNLRAEGAPAWSWHVADMINFSDATMEILDGWPGFVEQDVTGWIENTSFDEPPTEGTLGFWGYTVVQELEEYPESLP